MSDEGNQKEIFKIFSDNPIDNAEAFNFKSYVESLKKIIVSSHTVTPFSISINGKWGSGKTSLMKTLRKELDSHSSQDNKKKIRTVWFNAWKYSNADSLLASLASEIYIEIVNSPFKTDNGWKASIRRKIFFYKESVDISQQITDLFYILSMGKSPDFTKWAKQPEYKEYLPYYYYFQQFLDRILSLFACEGDCKNSQVNKEILVIFIDDLDRCSPNLITTILESINLFFDHKGCVFVFGMDLNLISSAIEKQYEFLPEISGKQFIEKMIQMQFNLPEIRDNDIQEYLKKEIVDDGSLKHNLNLVINCLGCNLRTIKQFFNSLQLMITLSDIMDDLVINEELLIKWTLLNFISSNYINDVKGDKELLLYMQEYSRIEDQNELDILRGVIHSSGDKTLALVKKYKNDGMICKVLRAGANVFTTDNLEVLIFLSGMTLQDSYVSIVASTDSITVNNPITFSGFCADGDKTVRLVISGPNNADPPLKEVNLIVNENNEWKYTLVTDYSIIPGLYIARVSDVDNKYFDEVTFSVEKGAITITASGDRSYYFGDIVRFSGTCTAGSSVFLSIILSEQNEPRKIDNLSIKSTNNDIETFVKVPVNYDGTWEYRWETSKSGILNYLGYQTIIASAGPFAGVKLIKSAYTTITVNINRPILSANTSQSTITQGDNIHILGTATGNPDNVSIWIFGDDFIFNDIVPVYSDGTFSFPYNTEGLPQGQYFVIVQHPMMNKKFDVYFDPSNNSVFSNDPKRGVELFALTELPGNKKHAVKKIINALNKREIDDIYVKLTFVVENKNIN